MNLTGKSQSITFIADTHLSHKDLISVAKKNIQVHVIDLISNCDKN